MSDKQPIRIAWSVIDRGEQQVDTAQVHLYEINRVLPDLTRQYLASSVLQARALQAASGMDTPSPSVDSASQTPS